MKIIYISNSYFFDMDLSFTTEMFKISDFYYVLDIPIYARNSTALTLKTNQKKAGIYPAIHFHQFLEYSDFLDLSKTFIIYRCSKKTYAISNLKIQLQLSQLIKKLDPTIIHCNNFLNKNFWLFLKTNLTPKLLTVHDPLPHSGEVTKKDSRKRIFNFKHIQNILLLNKSQTENFIRSTGFSLDNLYYSRLGAYTYLRKYSNLSLHVKKPFQVLFFGRISPYKGIEELCQAFKLIGEEHSKATLIIAGRGDFWFDVTKYSNLGHICIINRFIPNSELVNLIETSSFVVCPYTDATQSGVIMSAYALNKPVIATNVGGLKEMVSHEETGLLIEPSNMNELYLSIKKLIENRILVEQMERNIENLNKTGYMSWTGIAKDILAIYSTIK
jgi:glycosyltransferase involved in cell wall biosynthesis